MKSLPALAPAIVFCLALPGCGQTGPLYMPKTVARPPVVQPAPVPPVISTVPAQPAGTPSP
ncbi:LPS translocon maturation chaperone LptM [Massilia sp. DWR3-1-1]|uniref:LPS translocon maturation chaperone LptM n=1 Tax=Massilia sp. DWR3-1-1 TaxID=2804559 RepID=UPI003CFB855C